MRLTLIARSIKLGYRVGETICLDESTLRERLAKSSHDRFNDEDPIAAHDLVDCVIGDDPDLLRTRMRRAAATLGTKRFVSELAAPFLHEIGEAWAAGALDVQQEHVATDILQSQIHLMNSAYDGTRGGPTIVLATLPREYHGLGLQLVGLYLAASGAVPRVLGTDTPTAQIALAAKALHADAVGLSISAASSSVAAVNHLQALVDVLDGSVALWLGGEGASRITSFQKRAVCLNRWDEIDDALIPLGR